MERLTTVQEKFILHWGEMGTRWGVNRTVAQIHALLYLAPGPLPADEIAETLNVARSNSFAVLSWPAAFGNFQLEENTDVSVVNDWSAVAAPRSTSVALPPGDRHKCLRLSSP